MSKAGMFSMVRRSLWRSSRFTSLPEDRDRLLYVYFLTCPHQTNVGCYQLPDGYACADLGWSLDAYHASRDRIIAAGLIDYDHDTGEIYIDRWLQNCPPTNAKHAAGIEKFIYGIESDRLREKVEEAFTEVWNPNDVAGHRPSRSLVETSFLNGRGRP